MTTLVKNSLLWNPEFVDESIRDMQSGHINITVAKGLVRLDMGEPTLESVSIPGEVWSQLCKMVKEAITLDNEHNLRNHIGWARYADVAGWSSKLRSQHNEPNF